MDYTSTYSEKKGRTACDGEQKLKFICRAGLYVHYV